MFPAVIRDSSGSIGGQWNDGCCSHCTGEQENQKRNGGSSVLWHFM